MSDVLRSLGKKQEETDMLMIVQAESEIILKRRLSLTCKGNRSTKEQAVPNHLVSGCMNVCMYVCMWYLYSTNLAKRQHTTV